jgi:hypothetical protein
MGPGVLDPVCSDQCPIFVHIKEIVAQNNNYLRKIYNYSLADKDSINSGIARIDCSSLFNSDNVDTISVSLTNKIKDICDKHIPSKTVLIRPRDPLWMTNEIRHLMRKIHRQRKIVKRRNRPIDWVSFRDIRNKVIAAFRKAKQQYESKFDDELNSNHGVKSWWRLVKHYLKGKTNNNSFPSIVLDDKLYDDTVEIVQVMNAFFIDQSRL